MTKWFDIFQGWRGSDGNLSIKIYSTYLCNNQEGDDNASTSHAALHNNVRLPSVKWRFPFVLSTIFPQKNIEISLTNIPEVDWGIFLKAYDFFFFLQRHEATKNNIQMH